MGFYLETTRHKEKAEQLIKLYNAREVRMEEALDAIFANKHAVICVIRNPNFDAAAFCHSLAEFRRFNYVDDDRPRKWLIIEDRDMVEELTGYKEEQRRREEIKNKAVKMSDEYRNLKLEKKPQEDK